MNTTAEAAEREISESESVQAVLDSLKGGPRQYKGHKVHARESLFRPETPIKPADQPNELAHEEFIVDRKTGQIRQAGATMPMLGRRIRALMKLAERSLYVFGKAILNYDQLTDTLHEEVCNFFQYCPFDWRPNRKLILMPRGHLKTTIMKSLALHMLIQPDKQNVYFLDGIGALSHSEGRSTRILLASKTSDLAEATLGEVKQIIEQNTLLRALWPQCFWDNPSRQARYWSSMHIQLPRNDIFKEATIETIGVGGTKTGYHFNVHLLDDLIDLETANSPVMMAAATEWHKAARAFLDSDNALEYTVGTRWHAQDLYQHLLDNDPTIRAYIRMLIEDGQAIFPEIFTDAVIEDLRRDRGVFFWLNYMNSAVGSDLVDFDAGNLRKFWFDGDDICFEEDERDAAVTGRLNSRSRSKPALVGAALTSDMYDTVLGPGSRDEYVRLKYT